MIVVWSGLGILVIPLIGGMAFLSGSLVQWASTAAGLQAWSALAFSIGLLAGTAADWVVGRRLNRHPGKLLVDPATQQRHVLRRRHALFWINMEYWSIPAAFAALLPLFTTIGPA